MFPIKNMYAHSGVNSKDDLFFDDIHTNMNYKEENNDSFDN
jgi:hypothetical protein